MAQPGKAQDWKSCVRKDAGVQTGLGAISLSPSRRTMMDGFAGPLEISLSALISFNAYMRASRNGDVANMLGSYAAPVAESCNNCHGRFGLLEAVRPRKDEAVPRLVRIDAFNMLLSYNARLGAHLFYSLYARL